MKKIFENLNCKKPKKSPKDNIYDQIDARRSSSFSGGQPYLIKNELSETQWYNIKRRISRATRETHYKNNHKFIGRAIIFNHTTIRGFKNREGTETDRNRLENILKSYGFDVKTHNDLGYIEIRNILEDVAEEDHSNCDCFLIIVMSHGENGSIHAADAAYRTEDLWRPFLGENCPTLIDKPKLFFIQACRGTKGDSGVTYVSDNVDGMTSHAGSDETDGQITYNIPSTADILLFYSTMEGFVSFRNPQDGSWFIQNICLILEEHLKNGNELELYQFLTTVNREVAYRYQSSATNPRFDEKKAMPNFVSTLTKTFILKPKPK